MKRNLKRIVRNILRKTEGHKSGSVVVNDKLIIERFEANPDNTFLISFPRTGSHWLRMLTELYFGRPSLVRIFYYPERRNYLMLHTHDLELDVVRTKVIYLFRDPVETIYSQIFYHKEEFGDSRQIRYWTDLYGRHLDKWLHREQFSRQKTILTYEGMERNLPKEFAKVTRHFGETLEEPRLEKVARKVTKDEVRKRTEHDPQVVQLRSAYHDARARFRQEHGSLVWDVLSRDRPYLVDYFASEIPEKK